VSFFGSKSLLPKLLNRWGAYLLLSNEDLEKAEKLFKRRGEAMVFFSRLIPGIRSIIAFPAGIAKMPFTRYLLFTLAGSFLWNLLLAGVGYAAYDLKDELFALLQPVEKIVLFILLVVVFVYVFKVVSRVRELKKSTPK
jgi:membrane protein DedA with SNARE-associated domain